MEMKKSGLSPDKKPDDNLDNYTPNSSNNLNLNNESNFRKKSSSKLNQNIPNILDFPHINKYKEDDIENNYRKKNSSVKVNLYNIELYSTIKNNHFIPKDTSEFENTKSSKTDFINDNKNEDPLTNNQDRQNFKENNNLSDSNFSSKSNSSRSSKDSNSSKKSIKNTFLNNFEIKISNYEETEKNKSLISSSSSSSNNDIPTYSLNMNILKTRDISINLNTDSSRKSTGSKPVLILDKLMARRRSTQIEDKKQFTCSNYASKETDSNDTLSNNKFPYCKSLLTINNNKSKSLSSSNLITEKENCLVNTNTEDQLIQKIKNSPNFQNMNELKPCNEMYKKDFDSINSFKFKPSSNQNSDKKLSNSNNIETDDPVLKTDAETRISEFSDKDYIENIDCKIYKCTMNQVQELDEEYRDYNTYMSRTEIKKNSNGSLNISKNKSSNLKKSVFSKSKSKTFNSFDSENENDNSDYDKIKDMELINTLKSKKSIGSFESFVSDKSNSRLDSPYINNKSIAEKLKIDENTNIDILYQSIINTRKSSIKNKNDLSRKKNCFVTRRLVFIEDQKDFIENHRLTNYSKSSLQNKIEIKLTPCNQPKNVITSKSLNIEADKNI